MKEPPFEVLLKERKRQGFTQAQLCQGIISQSMLCQIETGRVMPSKKTLDRLCERLGMDAGKLWDAWAHHSSAAELEERLWSNACRKDASGILDLLNRHGCDHDPEDLSYRFYRALALALEGQLEAAETALCAAWRSDNVPARAFVVDAWTREEIYLRCKRHTAAEVWADRAKLRLTQIYAGDSHHPQEYLSHSNE